MIRYAMGLWVWACLLGSTAAGSTLYGVDETGASCWLTIGRRNTSIEALCPDARYRYAFSQYLQIETNYAPVTLGLGPDIFIDEASLSSCGFVADFSRLSGHALRDQLNGNLITGMVDRFDVEYLTGEALFNFAYCTYHEDDELNPSQWECHEHHTCFLESAY